MRKPVIGVLARILLDKSEKDGNAICCERNNISSEYTNAIFAAGGVPVIIPVACDDEVIIQQIERIDGLLVPGGVDINSLVYGEEPVVKQGFIFEEIDEFDVKSILTAYEMKKPILGICRGLQALNVAFGGTLYQDMSQIKDSFVKHNQDARRDFASHTVDLVKGSKLYDLFGETITTNSFHHQAIKDVAPGFKISALSRDNVIEAIEKEDESFVVSVQWHPEMMLPKHKEMLAIFRAFIDEAGKAYK